MSRDLRRHQRELVQNKLSLSWQGDGGVARYAVGRCLDVSESGMRVEVAETVRPRTYVSFRMEKAAFQGTGSVRYCRRVGMKYHLGLEFAGGLRWQAPTEPAA